MKIKKYLDKIFIIVLVAIFLILGYINQRKEKNINNDDFILETENKEILEEDNLKNESSNEEIIDDIFVDVSGCVINPGVYKMRSNQRVNDVIEMAGGLCEDADVSNINLSKKLFDEMKIHIIRLGEEVIVSDIDNSDSNQDMNGKINLNTASLEELETLPGIGNTRALEIISYRENTPFKNIEEIKNISGIGEKTYEKIKEKIIVN